MINYFDYNYITIDVKNLAKRISRLNGVGNHWLCNCLESDKDDLVLSGYCKFIKTQGKYNRKFVIRCKDAIVYSRKNERKEISISKLIDYNEILFSVDNCNELLFNALCNLTLIFCVQAITKDDYEKRLGSEIGEEISTFICDN